MHKPQYPKDLASIAYAATRKMLANHITKESLTSLIETAYFASLRTEELRRINCTLVILDPEKPHFKLPHRLRLNYWTATALKRPIPISGESLTKLAPTTSPSTAWAAIYYSQDAGWYIWGLVDQAVHRYNFITHEPYGGAYRVKGLQITIDGPGAVSVSDGDRRLATLRGPILHRESVDVLEQGPVRQRIRNLAIKSLPSGPIQLEKEQYLVPRKPLTALVIDGWMTVIRRVLTRARRYGHGGALLFLSDENSQHLKTKYELSYGRLRDAIFRAVAAEYWHEKSSNLFWTHFDPAREQESQVPFLTAFDYMASGDRMEDCGDEIDGCVSLVSSLARVDGAVLFGSDMAVAGFGCELLCETDPPSVFVANNPKLSPQNMERIHVEQFGTRHRSMMRFCWSHPGSLGFVISQDGAVRAVMRVGRRLVLWKDIQLERSG